MSSTSALDSRERSCAKVVVNGKTLPKYSRQQLEAMNKEIIRIRAMNIRDAMESLEVLKCDY